MTKLLNNFNFIRTTFILAIIFGIASLCFIFLAGTPTNYRWVGIPTTLIAILLLMPIFRAVCYGDDFMDNIEDRGNKK